MNSWWETPRYYDFIEQISNEISQGKIALVFLPLHTPNDFFSQLKISMRSSRNITKYERINLSECNEKDEYPIESLLYSFFGFDEQSEEFIQKKVANIFNQIEFNPSQVFVIEKLPASLVNHFINFIVDLGRYLISKSSYERHKVLVLLESQNFANSDFTSEPGLQRIPFKGYSDKLNQTIGLRYYYRFNKNVFTPLYESMIASLSVYDTKLSEILMDCDNLIEEYQQVLEDYAVEQKWNEIKYKPLTNLNDKEIWERWSKGILEKIGNGYIYHSAFLKINKKDIELNKRVWQSGLEILIPMIEEIRNEILKSDKLVYPNVFPNKKTGEKINSKMDLEIGDIYYFIINKTIRIRYLNRTDKEEIKKYIKKCREIRNDLSHLKFPSSHKVIYLIERYDDIKKILKN